MLRSTRSLYSTAQVPAEDVLAPGSLRRRVLAAAGRERGPGNPARGWRGERMGRSIVCAALMLGGVFSLLGSFGSGSATRAPSSGVRSGSPVVSLRRVGHSAELEISRMAEPPFGEVYELWLDRPGSPPRPTDALFTVTSAGSAAVQIPGSLNGVRSVLVTAEPLGGSSRPTSAPVLRVAIPG